MPPILLPSPCFLPFAPSACLPPPLTLCCRTACRAARAPSCSASRSHAVAKALATLCCCRQALGCSPTCSASRYPYYRLYPNCSTRHRAAPMTRMLQASSALPLPPCAIAADISIRAKAEARGPSPFSPILSPSLFCRLCLFHNPLNSPSSPVARGGRR
jgi:hypothetical protein